MVKDSMTSVWIKIISSWLCFAMYALVMLLPPMCPDRNFGPAARAEEMAGAQTPRPLLLLPPLSSANRSVPAARTLSREAAFAIRSWARRVDLRIGCGLNADLRSHHLGKKWQRVSRAVAMLCETKCMSCTLAHKCTQAVPPDSASERRGHSSPRPRVSGRPVRLPKLTDLRVSSWLCQHLAAR